MFSLHTLIPAAPVLSNIKPEDIPPPTPVIFPHCYLQVQDDNDDDQQQADSVPSGRARKPITKLLQSIVRPGDLSISHLEALGAHVIPDSTPEELIPDPSFIPDFAAWDALSSEEAHLKNESTRKRLNNGALSPGCQTYLDRKRELSIDNDAAFRTVRRLPAPKGQPQARLGNAYEFYRHLEMFTSYWDDTSKPVPPGPKPTDTDPKEKDEPKEAQYFRTSSGDKMPPDCRGGMLTSFLKLVAYDFGCNVSAPRVEPRLLITTNTASPRSRSSYFTSGCTFLFRSPTTREAARAGIVEGPLAAVSARHTISFTPDPSTNKESLLDLSRELISALITAQHRARENKTEKRIGEDAWWATKPRWGGGPGGPIGREIEAQSAKSTNDVILGDKDAPPPPSTPTPAPTTTTIPPSPFPVPAASSSSSPSPAPTTTTTTPSSSSSSSSSSSTTTASIPRRPYSSLSPTSSRSSTNPSSSSSSSSKRLKTKSSSSSKEGKKQNPIYDAYRRLQPPNPTWDKKAKYSAIGRVKSADYDDIFVISGLFHHISVVRVRVPNRLLQVLEGDLSELDKKGGGGRSWGKVEVRRSQWYDFFKEEERIGAVQLLWGVMAWLMREDKENQKEEEKKNGDVVMSG
ncbi:hypothetical protein QBC40DRAFT_238657 [Triangularia verruculosa]|uniref:Uncharacterized protein n=1 Tax=Triangularia verruculosa TaxID=2587418 RepID=A0AAN6X7D8_9PEZI|nr:hypothetical protein QBC40DRAFT_238657 [Triangularia verruculosa]